MDLPQQHLGPRSLDQTSVEAILQVRMAPDSFEEMENLAKPLQREGVRWHRRRVGWVDPETGEEKGLCVNEVRISKDSACVVRPVIAMAWPGLVDFDAIEYAYWQTQWATDALRREKGQRDPRVFVNMRNLICSRTGAPRGPWEDLEDLERRVANGEATADLLRNYPVLEPILREAPDSEAPLKVARYLPAFPPSWAVQANESVHVAVNGGYFLNFPEEYEDDGLSALHQPVGALYAHGQLHMPPWVDRPTALQWADGEGAIEMLGPENLVLFLGNGESFLLVRGIDLPHAAATVWRSFDGPLPAADPGIPTVDLVFCGSGLVTIVRPGAQQPPHGGAIVRLRGEVAQPWLAWIDSNGSAPFPDWQLSLQTSRSVALDWAFASGPRLVNEGRAVAPDDILAPCAAGEFRKGGPPPTRFPYDPVKARAPRTALGRTPEGEWVLVVVDGRFDMSHSVGATLADMARLMRHLGCWCAMNMDGGGSSVMVIEGTGFVDQLKPGLTAGVVNIPSDPGNRERIVPVALTVADR